MGGGGGFFSDIGNAISNVVSDISNVVQQDVITPVSNAVSDVGNYVQQDVITPVSNALSSVDQAVNNAIPGGWATIGGAALMAAGIYDPTLLSLADTGALTTADVSNAGYDAVSVADSVSQAATDAGFSDVATFNAATNAGFTDAATYDAATSAGFTNAADYTTAQSLGYSNAADFTAGQAGGFTNAAEYSTATGEGFTNAATYDTATSQGFTDAGTFNTAQTYGFNSAQDYATAAQQAGFSNVGDYTSSLDTLTNAGYNPQSLGALTQQGYSVQGLTGLAGQGYDASAVSGFAGQGFTSSDLTTLASNGFTPNDLTTFTTQGFGPQDLSSLSQGGFTPNDITTFTQNGFTPQQLGAISNGGFSPAEVTNLTTEGGFTPDTLSSVAQNGYTNADITQFASQGMTPQDMVDYTQGINPATGLPWEETGSGLAAGAAADFTPEELAALELGDTSGFSASQLALAAAAGFMAPSVLKMLGIGQTSTSGQGTQWMPIPTYNGSGLVNPGVNPGSIQPDQMYGQQQPGVDSYYWGQHGYVQNTTGMAGLENYDVNAVNAPASPYGNQNAVDLGQLAQFNYPTPATMAGAYGSAGAIPGQATMPNMSYDIYNNPVQMNTAAPAIAGNPQTFAPNTYAQMVAGHGQAATTGAGLNYVAPAQTLAATPGAGMYNGTTPASALTSVSPSDLSAQLTAAANAQA